MKHKYALIFITFLCAVLYGYGQTTVTYDFSDTGAVGGLDEISPGIALDGNIGFGSFQNSGTSNPGVFSGQLRLYQNAAKGGSIKIYASNGVTITKVVMYTPSSGDGDGPSGYSVDNTTEAGTFAAGGGTLTMDGLSATNYVEFYNKGTSRGTRTYVDYFEVTYTIPSTCTPPADPNGTITGTTPACTNTTLTYSGTTILGTIDYWQTTATGTSTANNATGTFNATATGTYYVRTFLTATSCWSAGTASYAVVINSAPSISTQPANATRVIPNNATFSVTATGTPAPTYQWQVSTNGGTTWTNVTGGSGATTNTYTTGATSAPMNGNQYRCVVTNSCGAVNSNAATLSLTNTATSNVTGVQGCFDDNSVTLNWTAPGTGTPTGYMIFALNGGTDPAGLKADANTYTANSDFSAATVVTPASLGRVVYKGAATTATITGLVENQNYSFTVYSYVGESLTGWSNGGTDGSTVTNETAQGDVRNLVATPLTNQVNLSWNNPLPTSCFDQLIIVANAGAVTFTPTGTYPNIDVNYTTPNTILYSTTAPVSSKAMNGLTNGTNYCFKIFIRRGATWSEGVEVCAVPSLTYCASSGNGTDGELTLINNVEFNTINNPSPNVDNAYSDFTSISTTVTLGETYNLDVRVNTAGNYTTTTRAWIDWNNNGTFDANEQYELGNAFNVIDGSTDGSPLAIEVPTNAVIAATRMRISTKWNTTASTACESGFDGEVEDYTINVAQPVNAEINIKGNNISIANGFNAPYGLNNTLFGAQNVSTTSAAKSYYIENIGTTNLNLTGAPRVQIIGAHAGDFAVTFQPAASIGSLSNSEFRIVFSPTADGTRTATVRIENTDSDEDPYEFDIQGNAVCSTVLTSSIWPIEGPENTEITITSANVLTGATATINGVAMTTVSSSATELIVSVPAGTTSGNLEVLFASGCSSINAFTIIDNIIGGCETASASTIPSDLFISQISDAHTGSSSLIEIFNGTGATVNLSNYSIRIFNNGSGSPSTTANLTGSLAANGVHVISVGTTSCDLSTSGLAGGLPNQMFNSAGGINFDNNSSDMVQLFNNAIAIDAFGVSGSSTWANGLVADGDGVDFSRQNTAGTLPSLTFDINEWDQVEWSTCGDSDYSDFGLYDFSLGVPPTVSVLNTPTFACTTTIQLSVTGTQGVPGGLGLAYQWYYLAPNTNTFVTVPNSADFSNISTNPTLDIVNPLPYLDYQFYCQVREDSATCYTASNAVKIEAVTATWTAGAWSNITGPDAATIAIIDDAYNTTLNGSFSACQLLVNAGNELVITNGHFVEVINNVVVNGNGSNLDGVLVEDKGSFVQRGNGINAGTYTLNTNARTQVNKQTAPLNNWYEYTYWSSPVSNETIGYGLDEAHPTRRYWYNGQNYLDSTAETNNNNGTGAGQDDVDDNGDDWQSTSNSDIMIPGVGYAAMHDPIGFTVIGGNYEYTFNGSLNTGDFTVPIYRNDSEMADNNWNFIGNPYPSAIDADLFLSANALIDQNVTEYPQPTGVTNGAIFLWSQNSAPSNTNNGNEVLNFAQSDYAVINGTGQTAGGDGVMPSRFIPSGQGFFITLSDAATVSTVSGDIKTADVIFQNNMRVTGNNNQFFRNTNENQNEKLWLNFTSDMGVFNQILIGYVPGATNGNDDMYFDAPKNLSSDAYVYFYSLIEAESDKDKVAIQGKAPESLNMDEIIPLGFSTTVNQATIYTISIAQIEGDFLSTHTIYLKDKLLNVIHNLSNTNYNFTSTVGEFNDRFEIVFRDSALSVDDYVISNTNLSIIELLDNNVKFSIGSNQATIKSVEIIDMLGRTLYRFKGSTNTETYNLSNLSSATYIAKVTLSNNQVLVKKAVKK
ncbi:GEVED domain-containing protein [Bizionia sp.]|uniref:GEVED domain-containing protein n=1 Tax=Bizionia sp. TaxID=1954480 RepID=UPI003A926328